MQESYKNGLNELIIEDELIQRNLLKAYIDGVYHIGVEISEIWETDNENTALQVLNSENISLIITDINHPGSSGITMLRLIKEKYPHIKIFLQTASKIKNEHKSVADLILIKPYKLAEIGKALTTLFN